jgi:hypothetical protein
MATSVWSKSSGYAKALLGTPKYELFACDAAGMRSKAIAANPTNVITAAPFIDSSFHVKKVYKNLPLPYEDRYHILFNKAKSIGF